MTLHLDQVRLKSALKPYGPQHMPLGRHRSAERRPEGLALKYHDHPIVIWDQNNRRIKLNLCGHWSTATIRAMKEYIQAIGVPLQPSISKGEFVCMYNGRRFISSWENEIVIDL